MQSNDLDESTPYNEMVNKYHLRQRGRPSVSVCNQSLEGRTSSGSSESNESSLEELEITLKELRHRKIKALAM